MVNLLINIYIFDYSNSSKMLIFEVKYYISHGKSKFKREF